MLRVIGGVVVAMILAFGLTAMLALILEPKLRGQFRATIKKWIDQCQF